MTALYYVIMYGELCFVNTHICTLLNRNNSIESIPLRLCFFVLFFRSEKSRKARVRMQF